MRRRRRLSRRTLANAAYRSNEVRARRRSTLNVRGSDRVSLLTVAPVMHNIVAPIHAAAVQGTTTGIHATSLHISKAQAHFLAVHQSRLALHEAKLEARAQTLPGESRAPPCESPLSLDKPYSPTQPLTGGAQDTTPIVGTLTPIQLETGVWDEPPRACEPGPGRDDRHRQRA